RVQDWCPSPLGRVESATSAKRCRVQKHNDLNSVAHQADFAKAKHKFSHSWSSSEKCPYRAIWTRSAVQVHDSPDASRDRHL
ncbi:MAG: hypothetical protein QGH20_09340, partial [Candidatus Latescibacteria bacterium]|nr:hypothetical protein [Candidatus Latescibacterota bacterium]